MRWPWSPYAPPSSPPRLRTANLKCRPPAQDELASCFIYQVGALTGFLALHGLPLNHVRPPRPPDAVPPFSPTPLPRSPLLARRSPQPRRANRVRTPQIKPHGAVYGMTARDMALARAAVGVAKLYNVPFMGLAGTCHQLAAAELGVPFIAGAWPPSRPRQTSQARCRVVRGPRLQRGGKAAHHEVSLGREGRTFDVGR